MKISVVIPTFNRRHLLGEAIDSALAQGEPGLEVEVIVVDDGSTDGTLEWLAEAYAGKPVRVLANARAKGPAGARNTGMLAADGELVALLDSDDAYLPGHLAAAAAAFAAHAQLGLVFGRARYEQDGVAVDYMGPNFERKLAQAPLAFEAGGVRGYGPGWFAHLLEHGCYFNLSSVVLRREAARERMDEQLRIAEDYEFWVRLARRWPAACLPGEHIRYRLHDANISFESSASAAEHAPMQLAAYRLMLDYPGLADAERACIRDHMAGVLFDWGWRCRQHRRLGEAARRHAQALRFGRRARNLLALAKLPLAALRPSGGMEPER
ncbi:glycosyltransferase family 2 protein [Pseudothauera nasutitermitis]|uniref:Glycosyltransferase family 2 protein n=1 Tax=Pseudothauera nasutitermitis TaxID=2565930 RepID=A0A4S4AYE9_9RHOO|nr:glycosyltransferase family 2 protein [Pseudothauera nasutitermitis]THF63652.1 glycosyltransferase family 2 protein [Pseudothauera nasutitermitis]